MKNTLIVGGNKGIGLALCDLLLKAKDHNVICTSRNYTDKFTQVGRLTKIQCDITSQESILKLSSHLSINFKQIDTVIICSGILHTENYLPEKLLSQVNEFQLKESYAVNAVGHLLLIKNIEKLISAAPEPIVCSLSARIGSISDNHLGGWYAYRMSKAALNMAYKTLEVEWNRKIPQAKLLLIHPGTTDSNLSKPFQKRMNKNNLQSADETAYFINTQINKKLSGEIKSLFIDYSGDIIEW